MLVSGRVLVLLLTLSASGAIGGEPIQTQATSDGSGRRMSDGLPHGTIAVTAGGQPGGIGRSSGGGFENYAGFLAGIILFPDLDTDGDGTPDEADVDNDDDGMADVSEIIADTDPASTGSVLRIVDVSKTESGAQVSWQGGVRARQRLMRTRNLNGGSGPWRAVYTNLPPTPALNQVTDNTATNGQYFYRVHADRP
jgi:hypothetical protein